MAVGQELPTCPEGSVFAIKSYFELIAAEETRQAQKLNKMPVKNTQNVIAQQRNVTNNSTRPTMHRGEAERWLDIFREKRAQCLDSPRCEVCAAVPDQSSSWLDIYREKRLRAVEERIKERRDQKAEPPKVSKKELERRIMTLISRCSTLNDILEQALIEEISQNSAFTKVFSAPSQKKKSNKKNKNVQRSIARCHF